MFNLLHKLWIWNCEVQKKREVVTEKLISFSCSKGNILSSCVKWIYSFQRCIQNPVKHLRLSFSVNHLKSRSPFWQNSYSWVSLWFWNIISFMKSNTSEKYCLLGSRIFPGKRIEGCSLQIYWKRSNCRIAELDGAASNIFVGDNEIPVKQNFARGLENCLLFSSFLVRIKLQAGVLLRSQRPIYIPEKIYDGAFLMKIWYSI